MKKSKKQSIVKTINNDVLMTRKEAILKTGKYAALTALGTFIILSPKKAQATSPENPSWQTPRRQRN